MAIVQVEGREREYDDTPIDYPVPMVGGEPLTPAPTPVAPPPTTTGGGRHPQAGPDGSTFPNMDPPGVRGGYWMNGQWVGGSPITGGGFGGDDGFRDGLGGDAGGGYGALNFPSYNPLSFDPGPAFTFREFTAPDSQSMLNEPGFQFRMDQGRKALEASAAGKGVLRSGGTLKDILSYGQNFASQEYGNVYDRALREYDTNRNNAFGNWQSQYGQRKDKYSFDEDANRFGFNAKQRQAEFDADDVFRRWAKAGDWQADIYQGGMD